MTSLLCVKQLGGTVEVHDPDCVEELTVDNDDNIETMYLPRSHVLQKLQGRRPQSTPTGTRSVNGVDQDAMISQTIRLQEWLNDKSVKHILEKADAEAKAAKQSYEQVLHTEGSFVQRIKHLLEHQDTINQRKKEILHKRWAEQVYQPIRRQVQKEADGPVMSELSKRRQDLYRQYLQHVNKKGHVFLDTISPDEYYALSLNPVRPGTVCAEVNRLNDPLLSQERNRTAEDRTILRCITGSLEVTDKDMDQIRLPPLPLVPQGRHGTDCATWQAMPMNDIESTVRVASRRRIFTYSNHSNIDLSGGWGRPDSSHQPKVQRRIRYPTHRGCGQTTPVHCMAPPSPANHTNMASHPANCNDLMQSCY